MLDALICTEKINSYLILMYKRFLSPQDFSLII